MLYCPRGSHTPDEALAYGDNPDKSYTLVDLHEAVGSLETAATHQLLRLSDLSGSATGIRARIKKFYENGVQRLEDCSASSNIDSCKVESSYEDINLMLEMLQEIDFFAGNATDTGLNHKKIQAAYIFIRENM